MIDITFALVSLLKDDFNINNTVSGRIYSDHMPQASKTPAIALWVYRENALDALDGPLGLDQPIVRIECYAERRMDASALRLQVRDYLGGFFGVQEAVFIKGIAQDRGQEHETVRVKVGTDQYLFRSRQDFRVTYESVADVGIP